MAKFAKSNGPSQRQLRVGELVRHAFIQFIQRGELHELDGRSHSISISEVAMSPDLKIATVYIAPTLNEDIHPTIKILARNAKFIRGKLTPALRQMKYMPTFRFMEDTGFENYSKIENLLNSEKVQADLSHESDEE
jgi:ribosome-binding factor A